MASPTQRVLLAGCLLLVAALLPAAAAKEEAWKAPSTDGWVEARTTHFTVYSDAGEAKATEVAVQLERFRATLNRISKGLAREDRAPTTIVAFRNDRNLAPYKLDDRGNPLNVAAYFLPTPFRNYIALDASGVFSRLRVVYHEYFHQVLSTNVGDVPLWLNEGLAEFFSTFKTKDRGSVVQIGHPIEEHIAFLSQNGLISWDDVFRTTTTSSTYREGVRQGSFYAQSWLAAHYMAATDERLKALGRYLSLLRDGTDPSQALQKAFGLNESTLAAAVDTYSKKIGSYIWLDLGEQGKDADAAVRKMEAAEVLFRLGDLLAHQRGGDSAVRHLEAARSAGWPPAEIETSLAAAALRKEDETPAEEHLRKAVAAKPERAEPFVVLGALVMSRAARTSSTSAETIPAGVEEARSLFREALGKQADSVPALVGYASTFTFESDTAPAVEALAKARQLQPHDWDVLRLGACLLARGGKPAAAGALVEMSIAPRNPVLAREVESCIARGAAAAAIDRMQTSEHTVAASILAEALVVVRDPDARATLAALQKVAASGDTVQISNPRDPKVDEFNAAVDLAKSGKLEEAATRFEAFAKDCAGDATCEQARKTAASLRAVLAKNAAIATYNRAIGLVNDGKRKDAIALLRQLEKEGEAPELLTEVQGLLRRLGQKPAR